MNMIRSKKPSPKTDPPQSVAAGKKSDTSTKASGGQKKTKAFKPPVDPAKLASQLLYRYHIVIFVVLVLGGIAVVILMLNQTLNAATDVSDSMPMGGASFDMQTIDKLKQLNDGPSQTQFELPPGRTNPFTE